MSKVLKLSEFCEKMNEETSNSMSPESKIEEFKKTIAPLDLRYNISEDPGYFGDEWDTWEHMDEEERATYFGTLFDAIKKLIS